VPHFVEIGPRTAAMPLCQFAASSSRLSWRRVRSRSFRFPAFRLPKFRGVSLEQLSIRGRAWPVVIGLTRWPAPLSRARLKRRSAWSSGRRPPIERFITACRPRPSVCGWGLLWSVRTHPAVSRSATLIGPVLCPGPRRLFADPSSRSCPSGQIPTVVDRSRCP